MISAQQKKILAFPYSKYDCLICDGAVRSGKTALETWAFIQWGMENFNGRRFGLCGKTVDSCCKNVVEPFLTMSLTKERYKVQWRRSEKILKIQKGNATNYFEVFGGKDESSFMLIQGRTLAGVFFDEVVLQPESFVNQALARCSVEGAKFWFSCNPGNPNHWFYKNWIRKETREAHNLLYLHFTMEDNLSLSKKTLERYRAMYYGVFYDRFVLGRWVLAEGLVYRDMFDAAIHVANVMPETEGDYYVSSDFGIQNATVFLLWRKEKGTQRWCILDEWYYSGRDESGRGETKQKTVSELVDGLVSMLGSVKPRHIIVDPSAAALKVELRKRGYTTLNADNDVINGIADVGNMLKSNRLLFSSKCKKTIEEFGLYCWDEKAVERGEDAPRKENDHCMDSVRYMVRTRRLAKRDGTEYKATMGL